MPAPARSRRAELHAVAGALLVGAFLRLYQLDYAQFRPDDETLWSLAKTVLGHPRVVTRGSALSFALSDGPFQAYLLLPGAALTSSPIGAYVVVALLNVAGLLAF